MSDMTGLEVIEYMKQGGTAFYVCKITGRKVLTKIKNGNIHWCFECELKEDRWHKECSFDFYQTYHEYIEPELTGWERVKKDEINYYIDIDGLIEGDLEIFGNVDNRCFNVANYFSTKEKAEEINFKQTLFRKLQRFSDENGGNEINWEDEHQCKYHIKYAHYSNKILVDGHHSVQEVGVVYFISKEITKKVIDLFYDDLIKYFTMQ